MEGNVSPKKITFMNLWKGNKSQKFAFVSVVGMVVCIFLFFIYQGFSQMSKSYKDNQLASQYIQDRKQSKYIPDEEYESKQKKSSKQTDESILKQSLNRCSMYDKMINDMKDKNVVKSLCREANLEYCALHDKCNPTTNNSNNAFNQLILILLVIMLMIGAFVLLNSGKKKTNKAANKPKNNSKNIKQPIYMMPSPYATNPNPYSNPYGMI
tara:strand:+ start:20 stop:652 length:633 start_codon:yes stop_codon:yes gene_type:complete